MKKFILASTSPRRRELLKNTGIDFEVKSPDFDENILNKQFSYNLVKNIAENKALSVKRKINYPAVIISADTVVINNDIILGKPKDFDDALNMLKALNNKTHKVVTSVCVIDTGTNKKIIKSETSEVTFNNVNENDLKSYINNFKPYDKAGSYGIQELPKGFIKEIKGDYENIVGLPVKLLINMIHEITNT